MNEQTQTCPTKTRENHWENQKQPKHAAQQLMKTIEKTKKNQKTKDPKAIQRHGPDVPRFRMISLKSLRE